MLEGATDGIWIKDTEGRYRMMNRSGARILGIDAEDAVGKNDFELFPAKHAQKVTLDDREILESGQGRTVEEVHMVNGVARTFDTVKGVCRDANGQVVALIGDFQDVTERKSVHEELRKARNELQSKVHERTADLARTNESLRREIAEHGVAQDALRESESRYRELVELSPDAIFVHAEGEFLFVNSAAVKLFGVTAPGDLIGTNVYDVIHPEYRAAARDRTRQMAASEELPFTELKVRRRDGSTVIVEVIAKRINYQGRPAIQSIHRDISERKAIENERRETQFLLCAMTEGATDGIFIKDVDGRYRMLNATCPALFGLEVDQVLGKDDSAIFPAERARAIMAEDRAILDSGEIRVVEEVVVEDGVERVLLTTKGPCRDADGALMGLIGVLRDVTEERRTAEALREAHDELESRVRERTADLAAANESLRREIAERKRAEDEVRRSEARYRHLYDRTPAMLQSYDRDLKLVSVSDHWLEVMGYQRDEVIGKYIHVTDETQRLAAEDSLPALRETGFAMERPRQVVKKNGEIMDTLISTVAERDDAGEPARFLSVIVDITERKGAEEALRRSEERYRRLYDRTPAMLQSFDRDLRFVSVSDYWLEVMGYGRDEVIGRPITEFVTEESRQLFRNKSLPALLRTGVATDLSRQLVKKDGEIMDTLISTVAERDDKGKPARFLSVIVDITERKRAEGALIAAKEEAEIASRAKSEFLANTSHELRTPLNAIIGFAEMMAGGYVGKLSAKQAEYVSDIRDSGAGLLEIINDILDLTKIESGQARLAEENLEVGRAVASAVRLIRSRAEAGGLRLDADAPANLPLLTAR